MHNKGGGQLIPMTPAFAMLRHPLAGGGMSSPSICPPPFVGEKYDIICSVQPALLQQVPAGAAQVYVLQGR